MVYKTILLTILSAFLLNAQIMLNPKRSDILSPSGGGGAAGGVPYIVYADTSVSGSGGADTLEFNHWGSIASGQLIMLVLVKEGSASNDQWGSGADTVSEAGWVFQVTKDDISNGDGAIGVFTKVATGSESGRFTVHSKESDEQSGWYIVMDSVNTSDPINIIGDTTSVGGALNASEIVLHGVTTDVNNCRAFGLAAVKAPVHFDVPDSLYTSNSGWSLYDAVTNRYNVAFTTGGMIATKPMWTAGATGDVTVHYGYPTDTGNDAAMGFIIAVEGINP